MTIDLNLSIEKLVRDKELSYMDAVLHYADVSEIEPEAMAKMLRKEMVYLWVLGGQRFHNEVWKLI